MTSERARELLAREYDASDSKHKPFTDALRAGRRLHDYHICIALRAIEAALGEDVAGWQPIETAPRDGTNVLLAEADSDLPLVGFCLAGVFRCGRDGDEFWPQPTHWQPLPDPPSLKQSSGDTP